MQKQRFKNSFAETIFKTKYAQGPTDTWDALSERVIEDVCGTRFGKDRALMSQEDRDQLTQYRKEMKFILLCGNCHNYHHYKEANPDE